MDKLEPCTLCKDFTGNPNFNNMCSQCFKKNTPFQDLPKQMQTQLITEQQKKIHQNKQNSENLKKQQILNTWLKNDSKDEKNNQNFENREKKLENLKKILISDKNSRPFLAFQFMKENNLFLQVQEAIQLTDLVGGTWIALHVFFSKCIDIYKIADGQVQLSTGEGAAGYYYDFKPGQMVSPFINQLSLQELEKFDKKQFPEYQNCNLCGYYQKNSICMTWAHGTKDYEKVDWTGYKQL